MYARVTLLVAALALSPAARAETVSDPAPAAARAAASRDPRGPAFAPGEQVDWDVEYLGVHTGTARLQVGSAEGDIWPVIAQARTEGLAKLFEIREHFVSYWDAPRQQTRGSYLEALELRDYHVEKTRYDREQGKATVDWTRKGRLKSLVADIPPDVHDLASAIMWLRLQPLQAGDVYDIPVFTGSHTFTMRAQVAGTETVKTKMGAQDAVRVDVQLGFKDEFKTSRPSRIWFSADSLRVPVKLAADFAVGTVVATMVRYTPGGDVAASR